MSETQSTSATSGAAKARPKKSASWEFVTTIIIAVVLALSFRSVAYEPFNIPSESMLPTLLVGDYLLVSKFSYGYSKHSFPLSAGPFSGRIFESPAERGDVAVFKYPGDNKTDYIKRIVGVPGDEIQVKAGALYINGKAVERERVEDFVHPDRDVVYRQYRETLPNGVSYMTLDCGPNETVRRPNSACIGSLDNTRPVRVSDGFYFAMGDNRDGSSDGRVFGLVPAENLVGRADVLFFSTCGQLCDAPLWKPWNWFGAMRYDRFFDIIH